MNHNLLARAARPVSLAAFALATCLAVAGCGGASTGGHSSSGSSLAASSAPAASTAPTPSANPDPAPPSGSRSAVVTQCAAQAKGDPASLSLCLAQHHIALPSGGKLVTCVESAQSSAELIACLKRAAR